MPMNEWLYAVLAAPRLPLNVPLRLAQGARFQPTGFPDLGAATYPKPGGGGQQLLLVESAQSVANRLEAVAWDPLAQDLVSGLQGLPYVRVRLQAEDGSEQITASVLEAHRLNSPLMRSSIKIPAASCTGCSCDLERKAEGPLTLEAPAGRPVPESAALAQALARAIAACREEWSDPPVTELVGILPTAGKKESGKRRN